MASTNGTLSMIGAKATCLSGSSSARPNTCLPSSRDIWRHRHLHERGGRLRYVDRLAGHGGGQTNLKPTCQLDHSVGADQGGKKNLNCYCAAG